MATVEDVFEDLRRHLVAFSPVTATRLGDHSRDGELDDWGAAAADERSRDLDALSSRLAAIDVDALDTEAAGDHLLVGDTLAAMRFELESLRAPFCDPLFYLDLATAGVYDLIRRDDLDAAPRQAAAAARAVQVPRLLDQARANLEAVPAPHRQVALLRAPGAAALFRSVLPSFAPRAADAGEAAAAACEAFAAWLEEGANGASPDWRLGEERWNAALRLALGVRMPAGQVWERGLAALDELQARMEELGAGMLGSAAHGRSGSDLVHAALDVCAQDHAPRDRLVPEAAGALTEIVDFLGQIDLFDLAGADALRVEEVPPFQQGVAVAFFVPAPPLETAAPHTYYLSPVPGAWDDDKAASFLREYNVHAVRSVGIHEAFPGHYVQFVHANRHPRLVRRALWNSAFAEGWAVYAEKVVIGAGFGGARLRLVSAKLQMRAVANALLDQGLHVHGWDDAAAMELMVGRTYQERSEAEGKLVRAQVTAGQLSSYFVGGAEMDDLRRDVAAARGGAFDLKQFHSDVLAQGSPPFAVLRRALLP
jgi:uncharacterized protein (DUF885 family)